MASWHQSSRNFNRGFARRSTRRPLRVPHPRVYDFVISRMDVFDNPQREIPARIVLLRYRSGDPTSEQLFLDQMPMPREAWDYDVADRILTWRGAYGGGRLHMTHDGRGATGVIGVASLEGLCSVTAGTTASFDCDVALDTGATYETTGGRVTGLVWDPSSSAWQNANWVTDRLRLSYTLMPSDGWGPPDISFAFQDNQSHEPQANSWATDYCDSSIKPVTQNRQNVWSLVFKSLEDPPPPSAATAPGGPDCVYPYWIQAIEDALALSINGVLVVDHPAPHGTLVGMQGVVSDPAASGYYRTSADAAAFGVFDSRMTIGGQAVPQSRLRGSVLHWRDLAAELQEQTGLPESGSLELLADGAAVDTRRGIHAARLNAADALAAIARHGDLHPELRARAASMQKALSNPGMDPNGLLVMNPFIQNAHGEWGDAVQAAVKQDLNDIMTSCIPQEMWELLFGQVAPPPLPDNLVPIVNSAVSGVSDPKAFYRSLATAVMTQGMANGSEAYCRNLNGPRAAAWLKTQLAASPVYSAHGKLLFPYEWQKRFSLTEQYLADQATNASGYATQIDTQVHNTISDINNNVASDPTDPTLKDNLIKQVQDAGNYSKTNNLFWAFWFYRYNTSPGILKNIAFQLGYDTGSSDATVLSRLLQQNIAVLTALDASGFFARQYTNTLNTFLVTNILPSMFDFTGDASSFDIIKLYLQTFCDTHEQNEDSQIAEAAKEIAEILADQEVDEILHGSIEILHQLAEVAEEIVELPYVAENFVKKFETQYPKFAEVSEIFGSVLIGGITGLAVFNLVSEFKNWDDLSDEQKAQLITNTVSLGGQILAAVVVRGVRIGLIFTVKGLTAMQRAAAVGKILATGEADALEIGLRRIGNAFARWVGDTAGTVGLGPKTEWFGYTEFRILVEDAGAEEASFAARVFGETLEDFVTYRLGPLLILAGIGYSLYLIAEGEAGVPLANDILNIVGGSLTLLAIAGGLAISQGIIAADSVLVPIITYAGPLAILVALAGIGLMIYELTQKPPDPVQKFVDDYANPAGFFVTDQSSSIDYAVPYDNPDQNQLTMVGFSLSANGAHYPVANDDGTIGSISIADAAALPNRVWKVQTDGMGLSQIITVVQPDQNKPPITVVLSLMDDHSISFQRALAPPIPPTTPHGPVERKIITQTWLSTPLGAARLTSTGEFLVSLPLTLQPVLPDGNGGYAPCQACGWLVQTDKGVLQWSATPIAGNSTTLYDKFTLQMSGMAPNYMRMVNLNFLLGSTPSTAQSFGPAFGIYPSAPMSYSVNATQGLPPFLIFNTVTGAFTPNGSAASAAYDSDVSITVTNALGSATAKFKITVTPTDTPAEAVAAAAADV